MFTEPNMNTDIIILDTNTLASFGKCVDVDTATATANRIVPQNHGYLLYDEFDLLTKLSAKEQLTVFNSMLNLNGADAVKPRENRFTSKAAGARAIMEAAVLHTHTHKVAKKAPTKAPTTDTPEVPKNEARDRAHRSGNCARVWAICDELNELGAAVRKNVIACASAEGIPKATSSTQFQKWRHRPHIHVARDQED